MNIRRRYIFTISVALLCVALLIVHRNWVISFLPLVSSDWPYFHINLLQSWVPSHPFWIAYDGLGRAITQGNFIALFTAYGWLAYVGVPFEITSRILFFLPALILPPVGMFLYAEGLTKNRFAAIAAAAVYSLNTYLIVIQGGHMNLAVAYSLAPLACSFAQRAGKRSYIWLTLVLAIVGIYEVRSLILILPLTATIYATSVRKSSKCYKRIAQEWLTILTGLASSTLFWIIPQMLSGKKLRPTAIFSQPALDWVSLPNSITLHHPFWSSGGVTDFVSSEPKLIYFAVPALAIIGLIIATKRYLAESILFAALAIGAIFMLAQENGPTGEIYSFLYSHIGALSAYRESSKFFLVLAFSYGSLVAIAISQFSKRFGYWVQPSLYAIVLLLMLLPIWPYLAGQYAKAFNTSAISHEIASISSFISHQPDFFRTLWVSRTPKFAPMSVLHPSVDALTSGQGTWSDYDITHYDPFAYLQSQTSKAVLNFSAVKYLISPSEKVGGNYANYANLNSEYFENIINANLGLQPMQIDSFESRVWKNDQSKDHIYISDNTVLVDGPIDEYSGIDAGQHSAYVFSPQLSTEQLDSLRHFFNNYEINPFAENQLSIKPGIITGADSKTISSPESYHKLVDASNSSLRNITVARIDANIIRVGLQNIWIASDTTSVYDLDITGKVGAQLAVAINGSTYSFVPGEIGINDKKSLGSVSINPSNNNFTFFEPIPRDKPLVSNGSFEFGIWKGLSDCNNADGSSLSTNGIAASANTSEPSNGVALKLEAASHLACVVQAFEPQNGAAIYKISYDYKLISGRPPFVSVYQGDVQSKQGAYSLYAQNKEGWGTADGFYLASDKPQTNTIFLYQPSTASQTSASLYDNINIVPFRAIKSGLFNDQIGGNKNTYTDQGPNLVTNLNLISPLISGENIYANGSFEDGKDITPGDCNNNDRTSLEQNGIKAALTNDARDGKNALVLEAKNHLACISQRLGSFDKNYDYQIKFEYKLLSGPAPEYSFYPRENKPYNRRVKLSSKMGEWQSYSTLLKAGDFSDQMSLIFYLTASGGRTSKLLLDNVRVYKIPRLPHVYLETQHPKLQDLAIKINSASATKYGITVSNLKDARLLVFSEAYNTGWHVALTKNGKTWDIPRAGHIAVNGYANGWLMNPATFPSAFFNQAGDYSMELVYGPQQYAYPSAALSWTCFMATLLTSLYVSSKSKAHRNNKPQNLTPKPPRRKLVRL